MGVIGRMETMLAIGRLPGVIQGLNCATDRAPRTHAFAMERPGECSSEFRQVSVLALYWSTSITPPIQMSKERRCGKLRTRGYVADG